MAPQTSEFVGSGEPLSEEGFSRVVTALDVPPASLWAVLAVETSGCGFLPDRQPKILFERHVFHRLTGGRFDNIDANISSPSSGDYGQGGAHQYERLARAIALDRAAALKSASWGLGQTMGENFASLGFADVESMVTAMKESEDQQLSAIQQFIQRHRLADALKNQKWSDFALVYNGPSYRDNNYDGKLRDNFAKLSTQALPSLSVRAAQILLMYLGLDPGPIDGIPGSRTRNALQQAGLAAAEINQNTIAALRDKLKAS